MKGRIFQELRGRAMDFEFWKGKDRDTGTRLTVQWNSKWGSFTKGQTVYYQSKEYTVVDIQIDLFITCKPTTVVFIERVDDERC
jgi:hypothetical protein